MSDSGAGADTDQAEILHLQCAQCGRWMEDKPCDSWVHERLSREIPMARGLYAYAAGAVAERCRLEADKRELGDLITQLTTESDAAEAEVSGLVGKLAEAKAANEHLRAELEARVVTVSGNVNYNANRLRSVADMYETDLGKAAGTLRFAADVLDERAAQLAEAEQENLRLRRHLQLEKDINDRLAARADEALAQLAEAERLALVLQGEIDRLRLVNEVQKSVIASHPRNTDRLPPVTSPNEPEQSSR